MQKQRSFSYLTVAEVLMQKQDQRTDSSAKAAKPLSKAGRIGQIIQPFHSPSLTRQSASNTTLMYQAMS